MKIVVLDGYALNPGDNPWTDLKRLGDLTVYERSRPEEIRERIKNAEIVLTNKAPLPGDVIDACTNLKLICVLATGYNIVDVTAAVRNQALVSNVPDYGTDTVAQYALAMILELCHHVGEHARAVREGAWTNSPDWTFWHVPMIELRGKTLGIVGFGRIGQRLADLANIFGMRVIYHSRKKVSDRGETLFALEELFAEADFISLHCGLTAENAGIINNALIGKMKPTAFLINTARGALVNEEDLAQALNTERIAGAAVDVLSNEPPITNNPLLTAKNCLVTPHVAWATLEARQRIMKTTVENVRTFIAGKPSNIVS